MFKKIVSIACIAVFTLGVLGSAANAELKVGMVFDIGGKGDQSFNDSAFRGIQWAAEDFGISHVEIESPVQMPIAKPVCV